MTDNPQGQVEGRNPDGTFAKGFSGNPGGMKPGRVSLATLLRNMLDEIPEGEKKTRGAMLVEKTWQDAMNGDGQSRKLCWEYVEGKPKDNMGEPVSVVVQIVDDV